jgi:hypothetical protein
VTYFPDGSSYVYEPDEPNAINVGWLDAEHPVAVGEVSDVVVAALTKMCRAPVRRTRGWHPCPLCPRGHPYRSVARDDRGEFAVGDAEIRVLGVDGETFAAPTMIVHYVAAHGYCPPAGFQSAVLRTAS